MLRKSLLAAGMVSAAILLSGCMAADQDVRAIGQAAASAADQVAPPPSTPLQQTKIDDNAIVFAYRSFDLLLDVVDTAMAVRGIRPGSELAIQIADGIKQTRYWLGAASAAQKAGQAQTYREAFDHADQAVRQIKDAIGEGEGR